MTLQRDFELEQMTGECSYCGAPLTYSPDTDSFNSCGGCDEYDEWGWIDDEPDLWYEILEENE